MPYSLRVQAMGPKAEKLKRSCLQQIPMEPVVLVKSGGPQLYWEDVTTSRKMTH